MSSQREKPDLLFFHSSPSRCLIAPCTANGLLALRQLCDRSMPRIGDALLLTAAQGNPVCRYLDELRLSVKTWHPRFAPDPSPAQVAIPPAYASSPLRSQPLLPLAVRLAANWCSMPLRRWITIRSLLTLPPGGQVISIPLPPEEQRTKTSR